MISIRNFTVILQLPFLILSVSRLIKNLQFDEIYPFAKSQASEKPYPGIAPDLRISWVSIDDQ
jgi:hypothetical protein